MPNRFRVCREFLRRSRQGLEEKLIEAVFGKIRERTDDIFSRKAYEYEPAVQAQKRAIVKRVAELKKAKHDLGELHCRIFENYVEQKISLEEHYHKSNEYKQEEALIDEEDKQLHTEHAKIENIEREDRRYRALYAPFRDEPTLTRMMIEKLVGRITVT